jgi:hypothetical protein
MFLHFLQKLDSLGSLRREGVMLLQNCRENLGADFINSLGIAFSFCSGMKTASPTLSKSTDVRNTPSRLLLRSSARSRRA